MLASYVCVREHRMNIVHNHIFRINLVTKKIIGFYENLYKIRGGQAVLPKK